MRPDDTPGAIAAAELEFRWPDAIDATLGDAVIALYNDTIQTQTILGYTETLTPAQARNVMERMDESVRRREKYFFGIHHRERLVGMALLTPNSLPNCRHIVEWSKGIIHTEFRGRGVLRCSLLALSRQCAAHGWERIILDVRAETRAHHLWVEMGFSEYGRLQDYARVDGVSHAGAYLYAPTQHLIARLSGAAA